MMINANMRLYDYYTYESTTDEYGQKTQATEPKGKIKMALYISSQSAQDNILFQGCEYVGLTHDTEVNDTYVIQNGKERLKVLYVSPQGRWKQVYLMRVE